jgi:hypothetical protein
VATGREGEERVVNGREREESEVMGMVGAEQGGEWKRRGWRGVNGNRPLRDN